MAWYHILILGFALLFVLFLAGAPIFLAFLLAVVTGIVALIGPAGFPMYVNSLLSTTTTTSLASIPLFILMGELLFRSGTMDVLFNSIDKLIGNVRGRQYVLVVSLSAVFGALSGAAMAVAAMLGRAVMPGMHERGYDRETSAGLILAGASLAPIIPPSLLAIIVGTLADVSIAKLLIAGILPGLFLSSIFLGYVFLRVRFNPDLAPPSREGEHEAVGGMEKFAAVMQCLPFLLVIFSVMGLIMLGIATPSESAATGVAGALLTAAVYRKLALKMIFESAAAAISISTMIIIIMAMSKMFTQLLAYTGATTALVGLVAGLDWGSLAMLLLMLAVPFVLCMFIDTIAVMLLTIPIYQPVIHDLGFDPVWFWLLFLVNVTVGAITPPFGYTLFAFKAVVPQMSIGQVFRASWPFVLLFLTGMGFMIAFPGIVTFFPSLF
jgi:tripartite ATP-independent transporter DctM subunit